MISIPERNNKKKVPAPQSTAEPAVDKSEKSTQHNESAKDVFLTLIDKPHMFTVSLGTHSVSVRTYTYVCNMYACVLSEHVCI